MCGSPVWAPVWAPALRCSLPPWMSLCNTVFHCIYTCVTPAPPEYCCTHTSHAYFSHTTGARPIGLARPSGSPTVQAIDAFKQNSCMHQQHTLCARSHSIRTSRLPVLCSGSGAPPHSGASARPQPHRPGDVLAGSEGQPPRQSSTPSPSRSAHRAQHGSMLSTWLPY